MSTFRIKRVNSLLKEVISEVIRERLRNPNINEFVSVSSVDTSKDIRHAKVFISMIANEKEKAEAIKALNASAGFISVNASQKVRLRYFPELIFKIDNSAEDLIRMQELIGGIEEERKDRDA